MSDEIVPQEQTANSENPAVSEAANEQLAENLAESAPAESSPKDTGVKGSEPKEEPKHIQELKHLRKRAQEAEQKNAFLEGQLVSQKPAAPTVAKDPGDRPPSLEHYERYEDWEAANIDYLVAKKLNQVKAQERQADIDRQYNERFQKALERYPDLPDKLKNVGSMPVQTEVITAIKESDLGPELVNYLVNNQMETYSLARMNPLSAVRELGRIEASLKQSLNEKPKIRNISQAPPPINPVNSASSGIEDDSNLSTEEWIAKRNKVVYRK